MASWKTEENLIANESLFQHPPSFHASAKVVEKKRKKTKKNKTKKTNQMFWRGGRAADHEVMS